VFVGRTLAVGAIAGRAVVIGAELAAEVSAGGQVIVRAVEALALRRGSRPLGIGEVRVTIAVSRKRQSHHRDRKQSSHDHLAHRNRPLGTRPPSRVRESFDGINTLPYSQTERRGWCAIRLAVR